ncbi:HAD family hydrolase [Streptomyces sp. B5E4]|uniref:HAD family hydrolase n=1 Tax=Streptomyces sp. B5E4 TaxID=3153568 RepID=UPI00325EA084
MRILAVVWDIDDTIFDHSGAERRAALEYLTDRGLLGRYASPEAAAAHWHEVSEEYVDRYLAGEFTFLAQRRERARVLAGRPLTDAEADVWMAGYLAAYRRHWRVFPDVVPALDGLTPARRHGLLSNNSAPHQEEKLRAIGVHDRFEALVCSEEIGVAKPAAGAFHAACAALGLPPERVAYVGDRPDTDAAGADAAGLTGIWLDRAGAGVRAAGTAAPDVRRITSPAQLGPLLGTLDSSR